MSNLSHLLNPAPQEACPSVLPLILSDLEPESGITSPEIFLPLSPCSRATSLVPDPSSPPTTSPSLPVLPIPSLAIPDVYVSELPTHAGCHPDALVQTSRKHPGLSEAQKATRKVRQEALRVEQGIFNDVFTAFLEKRYDDLVTFAVAHNRKIELFEKLMNTSSHYKPKRAVNLQNAKIYAKAAEINAEQARGDCVKLSDIRQMVKEDPALQTLLEEAEEILKNSVNLL